MPRTWAASALAISVALMTSSASAQGSAAVRTALGQPPALRRLFPPGPAGDIATYDLYVPFAYRVDRATAAAIAQPFQRGRVGRLYQRPPQQPTIPPPGAMVPSARSLENDQLEQLARPSVPALSKGEYQFREGHYAEAAAAFQKRRADRPTDGMAALWLAQAHFATGDYAASATALRHAMNLLPKDRWGAVADRYEEIYPPGRDYVQQVKALEEARRAEPNRADLRIVLGHQYGCLGYASAAIDELNAALTIEPGDGDARRLLDHWTSQPTVTR